MPMNGEMNSNGGINCGIPRSHIGYEIEMDVVYNEFQPFEPRG